MARYTGPVCKLCRREGMKLFLKGQRCYTDKCGIEKRNYPPGEHGRRRIKETEYLIQLREKQKAKRVYGVLEKQFRNYYKLASHQTGITGENLLRILETRLDNVVYRAGLAASRAQARQLVLHGYYKINDSKANVPSMRVSEGDKISVAPKGKDVPIFQSVASDHLNVEIPEWLSVDQKRLAVTVAHLPRRDEIDLSIEERLIVELYSK